MEAVKEVVYVFLLLFKFILSKFTSLNFKNFIMARLNQGILGGISGKIGNVIGSSWKGIPVVKSRPLSVANPKTAGQIAQRSKMTNIVAFAEIILAAVIKPLWDRFSQGMSGYNAFVQSNISLFAAFSPSPAGSLIISKGKMTSVTPTVAPVAVDATSVLVSWSDVLPDSYSLATDDAFIVVVDVANSKVYYSAADVARSVTLKEVDIDDAAEADNVYNVYLAFRRTDGTVVSNTGYATVTAS